MVEGELIIDPTGVGTESTLREANPFEQGVLLRLRGPSTFTIELGGVVVLKVANDGGGVRIDLGDGAAERLVLGDSFRSWVDEFIRAKFDAHTHQLPSGQATTPPMAAFTGTQMPETLLSTLARSR